MKSAVAAKTSSTGVASSPMKEASPTAAGRSSEVVTKVEAKRYSFHPSKNAITPTVMRAGTDRGSVIRHRMPMAPHPSMRAASRTSRGIVSMKLLRIQTPTGR